MHSEIYWIQTPAPGRLATAPRPRGGDWLEDEIRAWRESGVHTVVSLLEPAEMKELGLEEEERLCRIQGMEFRSLPIPDFAVPSFRAAVVELAMAAEEQIRIGRSVLIHCRQGIGRSTLIAAAILMCLGETPEAALASIETARGRPVPDTVEQREWVLRFAEAVPHVA